MLLQYSKNFVNVLLDSQQVLWYHYPLLALHIFFPPPFLIQHGIYHKHVLVLYIYLMVLLLNKIPFWDGDLLTQKLFQDLICDSL